MNLNFDGYILNSIYFAIVFAVIIFMMINVYHENKSIIACTKLKDINFIQKSIMVIKIALKNFLRSIIWLSIANIPLAITVCVIQHEEVQQFPKYLLLFYIIEIIEMMSIRLNADDSLNEKNLANKISEIIFFTIILSSILIALVYFWGSRTVTNKNSIQLINGKEYAITYSDGDTLVLHKVDVIGKQIIIHRNQQKILNNNNYEYLVFYVDDIVIKD